MENALLVSEYVNDVYAYYFELERKYAIRKNHLDGQAQIKSEWRTVLLNWISEVHTEWRLTQDTFHTTVSIIDRYLQVSENICYCKDFHIFIFRVFFSLSLK